MTDLTNKPEGAAHYYVGCNGISFFNGTKAWHEYSKEWGFCGYDDKWIAENGIEINNYWSIYNNTLPLSELSDEQRGLLFNHHFGGGDILDFGTGEWIRCRYPTWDRNMEYRAKQKSERELFIETWVNITSNDTNLDIVSVEHVEVVIAAMFDTDEFKALKDGK